MNKKYSLKKNYDIEKLVKERKSVGNTYYAIYYNDSNLQDPKIAISVSKKLGKAVVRNYEKRVIREIVSKNMNLLTPIQYLIIVKVKSMDLTFKEKEKELKYLFKKIRKNKGEKE